MNILVLNGSPAGKNSITLQTVLYIEKFFPDCSFEILHVGQRIKSLEKDFAPAASALRKADLLLFSYPVYTFLVPAQLHRFLELIRENGVEVEGKFASQISTSKHFYDVTAHRFLQDFCDELGLRSVRGLSADMEDLLNEKGRGEALAFFRYVLWSMEHDCSEPRFYKGDGSCPAPAKADAEVPITEKKPGAVALVTDLSEDEDGRLQALIDRFSRRMDRPVRTVDIGGFPFAGGCLGCFHCAADGTCVYKDGFDAYLRDNIQAADATVYAFRVKDHSMGYRFKLFDDRQFCNGHRTVTMGKPVGYLVDGSLEHEPNLRMLLEARAQVGGNFLAGIAADPADPDRSVDQLALTLGYALDQNYQPPQNFYGVGGMKIFRDLIYQMQGLMQADHRFYKEHGFYDFPQKHRGRVLGMYLVGSMMRSKRLGAKLGGRMTEGMLMPYRKVLQQAERESGK